MYDVEVISKSSVSSRTEAELKECFSDTIILTYGVNPKIRMNASKPISKAVPIKGLTEQVGLEYRH